MRISARVSNQHDRNMLDLQTGEHKHSLDIPAKANSRGSSVNGGELLFLALATCYCNDIYREAGKRGIEVRSVEVEVSGEFGNEGEAARDISGCRGEPGRDPGSHAAYRLRGRDTQHAQKCFESSAVAL
ncbi:OsmC family protein [Alloacidobacterium sp.]|uniref:OsmC family protein n=1 Tax=Alloacidobacterium sp. TaxID=2951999 RepID=UPI0039C871B0